MNFISEKITLFVFYQQNFTITKITNLAKQKEL